MARNVFKCFAPTSLLVFAKGPCVLIGCIFKAQAVYNALSLHFILAQNLKISQMEKTGVLSDPGREIDLPDHQEYVRAFESVRASLVAQTVKRLSAMQEMWVRSLGWKDPLEKETAVHSNTLAWKIPWTEEPGRLQTMGLQSRTQLSDFTFTLKVCSEHLIPFKIFPLSFWPGFSFLSWHGCLAAAAAAAAKSLQSCPTLCDPIDGSPLGSSVPGILQARVLEWVAISFSNA